MSVRNRIGAAIFCRAVIPNSDACFIAVTRSDPDIARTMTFAPDARAASRYGGHVHRVQREADAAKDLSARRFDRLARDVFKLVAERVVDR